MMLLIHLEDIATFIGKAVMLFILFSFAGLVFARYAENKKWTTIFEVITSIFALLLLVGLVSLLFID